MGQRLGRSALVIVGGAAVVGLFLWPSLWHRAKPDAPATSNAVSSNEVVSSAREAAVPPARSRPRLPDADVPEPATEDENTKDGFVPAPDSDAIAEAWSVVDLDEVRKALPNNLYFDLSAPTNDPDVIAERQAERERWNVEYGKVLSGTGTEEEIRDYYDQRARLSTDYVEFTTYLLDHYGDELPERDVGLLELARRLHLARLEEIPRKVEEALERKHQQDAVREAWLADEAAFGAANRDGKE